MFWQAPFYYKKFTKNDRVFQEHMQRVTSWPRQLIGNTVVFISLAPEKESNNAVFKNPDVVPILYLFTKILR